MVLGAGDDAGLVGRLEPLDELLAAHLLDVHALQGVVDVLPAEVEPLRVVLLRPHFFGLQF